MYLIKASATPTTPQDSVENIPSLDQCWLQCIAVLSSFANNSFHMNSQVCLPPSLITRSPNSPLIASNAVSFAVETPSHQELLC